MPFPVEFKKTIEDDILTNLSNISVKVRAFDHDVSIELEPIWVREKQLEEDLLLKNIFSRPVCVVSYPIEDIPSQVAFSSLFIRDDAIKYLDFSQSDEVIDSSSVVIGSTKLSQVITITEPTLYSVSFIPSLPAGSTSWLKVSVLLPDDTEIFSKILYNEEINVGNWQELTINAYVVEAQTSSVELTVVFEEFKTIGSSPIGVGIGLNEAGDAIVRAYRYTEATENGYVREAIFQLDVFTRDKERGQEPYPEVTLSRKEIADQICETFRKHVIGNWLTLRREISYVSMEQTPLFQEWLENLYIADAQVQIHFRYEELVPTEYEILKGITVKDIVRL